MGTHRPRKGMPDGPAVLCAARDILHEDGVGGLTVRALAARLGVSRQVVASRFGSMAGLLDALYADGFTRLAADLRSIPSSIFRL